MDKIIELIYKEKSTQTNVALFTSSVAGFIAYFTNQDIVFIGLVILAIFSVTKIIITLVDKYLQKKSHRHNYSESELNVIDTYIERSTCFISHSQYEHGVLEEPGLTSLVNRNIISFEESMDKPTGFLLDEEVYQVFLRNK